MECPRCGGRLRSYQLGDANSQACEDCAYVGVFVDHRSQRENPESWDDALSRFRLGEGQSDPDDVQRLPDAAPTPFDDDADDSARSGSDSPEDSDDGGEHQESESDSSDAGDTTADEQDTTDADVTAAGSDDGADTQDTDAEDADHPEEDTDDDADEPREDGETPDAS